MLQKLSYLGSKGVGEKGSGVSTPAFPECCCAPSSCGLENNLKCYIDAVNTCFYSVLACLESHGRNRSDFPERLEEEQ